MEISFGTNAIEDYQNIEPAPGGGYVFACTTFSNNTGDVTGFYPSFTATPTNDSWIVKIDESGNILWKKCYGGSGGEWTYGLFITESGNILISNYTNTTNNGDVTDYWGAGDIWILCLSSSGTLIWKKTIGGSGHEDIDNSSKCIVQLSDGNFVITATTESNNGNISGNHGGQDILVVKLNAVTGTIIWQKCLGGTLKDSDEFFTNLYRASNDDILLFSTTLSNNGDVSGNHGGADIWGVRLNNSNGSVAWQKCFGGSQDDYFNEIIPAADGGWLLLGDTYSNNGDITGKHGTTADSDMWVVKLAPETIPCATAHTIVNRHSGTTLTYKASDKIKASNLIEPVISPATTITYQASNSTLLTPGFEAKKGVVFKAQIGGCN